MNDDVSQRKNNVKAVSYRQPLISQIIVRYLHLIWYQKSFVCNNILQRSGRIKWTHPQRERSNRIECFIFDIFIGYACAIFWRFLSILYFLKLYTLLFQLDVFFNTESDFGEQAFAVSTVLMDDYLNSFKLMICTQSVILILIFNLKTTCLSLSLSFPVPSKSNTTSTRWGFDKAE